MIKIIVTLNNFTVCLNFCKASKHVKFGFTFMSLQSYTANSVEHKNT